MAGIKPKDLTQNYTGDAAVTWVHGDNATTSVSERVSIQNIIDATGVASKIDSAEKGANSGLATLDASGLVPTSQLPSYVDDVLEYADEASFPVTGETAKIYVALDVNLTFRWSGSAYIEISKSLALGETETTAYRGDRGKLAYDHSQLVHDKAFVGLGNVDNTADADKPLTEEAKLLAATMTKADFFALAEQRKRESAGSGSLEWGKHYSTGSTGTRWLHINEGLWVDQEDPRLWWGSESPIDADSKSRTFSPIQLVGGVQHRITNVNTASASETNAISFPDAPDGTRTYDSATGVVTPHATSNEAFEGLCTNGDFRNGDDGNWTTALCNITVGNLHFPIPSGETTAINNGPLCDKDTEYRFEFTIENTTGVDFGVYPHAFHSGGRWNFGSTYLNSDGRYVLTIPAGTLTADYNIGFFRANGHTGTQDVKNVSVMPVTESVITSRKDLAFLETWHEAIDDKDVVYPLGNVQYGAVTYKGIALDNTLVAQGYSAFGEWDTTTTGRGALWSTMTFDGRMKFIGNPENNTYFDSETNQYIQVRYRIRVIEGLGDEWTNVSTQAANFLRYDSESNVVIRGSGSGTFTDFAGGSTSSYHANHTNTSTWSDGMFTCSDGYSLISITPRAVPICLVQRLNQGAYHPVYNPQGCASWMDTTTGIGSKKWYEPEAGNITSTSTAFNRVSYGTSGEVGFRDETGGIADGSNHSGRDDQYEYYDAIYAGQVEDLRLNANKLDLNRLLEDSKRSDVAGTTRGKGKVTFTKVTSLPIPSSSSLSGGSRQLIYNSVNYFNLADGQEETVIGSYLENSGVLRKVLTIAYALTNTYITLDGTTNYTSVCNAVIGRTDILSAEYDSIPHVDLIGSPENIALTFPDGVIGEWIPVIPTGAVLEYPLNRKALTGSVSNTYTSDNGLTWGSLIANANTGTNSFNTALAANNVGIWQYESLSDFTEPSVNSKVIGQVGDVVGSSNSGVYYGNRLHPSLTGGIGKGNSDYLIGDNKTTFYKLFIDDKLETLFSPEHAPLYNYGSGTSNDSAAVKTLTTLTEKDGLIYAQYHFAELKHDGTDWGDDNTIPIVDNMSTKTDDNAVTVSIGCHTGKIPLGIA